MSVRDLIIVGAGPSGLSYRSGAHVTLVHRHPTLKRTIKYWVRPDIENRIKEGSIAARFSACVTEIHPTSVVVRRIPDEAAATDDGATRQRELFADADASRAPASALVAPAVSEAPPVDEIPTGAVYLLTGYRADAELLCRRHPLERARGAGARSPDVRNERAGNFHRRRRHRGKGHGHHLHRERAFRERAFPRRLDHRGDRPAPVSRQRR